MTPDISDNSKRQPAGRQLSVVAPLPLMIKPSLSARAIDRVLPGKGKLLMLCWLLAVIMLAIIFNSLHGTATRFYGIAESRTQSISFQYPVEIVNVPVVAGQQVGHETQLLEVRRYDLDIKLAVIEDKINEISAQRATLKRAIKADIDRLDGERMATTEALTTKITNLTTRYRLNQALVASLSGESVDSPSLIENPALAHINGLKAERRQIEKLYQSRITGLQRELLQKQDPDTARLAELQKQKQELNRQSQALSIIAPFSGSVGGIAFKPGEQVEPFLEVMSVIGSTTRRIKAYIHEAVINEARLGQSVWIQPLDAGGGSVAINGRIMSMGSRIVEYPARLKRNPLVSAWGREVIVEVEQNSDLMVGEKVAVLLQRPQPLLDRIIAMADRFLPISTVLAKVSGKPLSNDMGPAALESAWPDIESSTIEASGIVDVIGKESFYLISDEHSVIFELDSKGELIHFLELPQLSSPADIESISRDENWFYVLASLSPKNDGKLGAGRRQFSRFSVAGDTIATTESIDLYQVLHNFYRGAETESELKLFLASGFDQQAIEIEAHRVVQDRLYLGFKKPHDADSKVVLLSIDSVRNLFAGKPVNAAVWIRLDLIHPDSKQPTRLTDFDIAKSGLYLLSVERKAGNLSSLVWHYDFAERKLHLLTTYEGLNAEGISINSDESVATIVFDGGGQSPSRVASVGL